MEKLSSEQMVTAMSNMENGERIVFLKYLREHHFFMNPITEEESRIIDDLRDGYVKVVENDEV